MDQGEWITALRKLGVILREMFLIGEGDHEGVPLYKLRDELEDLIKGFGDSNSIIRVMRTRVFPEAKGIVHRVREEIAQFSFGPSQEELVTLNIAIIIDNKGEQTIVRNGSISVNPRMYHHTCPGCESMTQAEYHENNLCVIDQIVTQLGFPSLARTTVWTFNEDEKHPLLAAFERHWKVLRSACRQQEYIVTEEDIFRMITDANPTEFIKSQSFAFSFVIGKEMELYEGMEETDTLPTCNCEVKRHKDILIQWLARNIPA